MRVYDKVSNRKIVAIQNNFDDSDSVSSYALEAVNIATRLGLIKGKENNYFSPKDSVTRAEASALICRIVESLIQ